MKTVIFSLFITVISVQASSQKGSAMVQCEAALASLSVQKGHCRSLGKFTIVMTFNPEVGVAVFRTSTLELLYKQEGFGEKSVGVQRVDGGQQHLIVSESASNLFFGFVSELATSSQVLNLFKIDKKFELITRLADPVREDILVGKRGLFWNGSIFRDQESLEKIHFGKMVAHQFQ